MTWINAIIPLALKIRFESTSQRAVMFLFFSLAKVPTDHRLTRIKKTPSRTAAQPAQKQKAKPILALLALSNLCQDELLHYLADRLTEKILIALTRFSSLPVMGGFV